MEYDTENIRPSRTQVKKEAEALQKLGEQLLDIPVHCLDRLALPEALCRALKEWPKIRSKIARRRHRQFIGALMRDLDVDRVRRAVDQPDAAGDAETSHERTVQNWMDQLSTGNPKALEKLLGHCPGLARQQVRQLLRNMARPGKAGADARAENRLRKLISEAL